MDLTKMYLQVDSIEIEHKPYFFNCRGELVTEDNSCAIIKIGESTFKGKLKDEDQLILVNSSKLDKHVERNVAVWRQISDWGLAYRCSRCKENSVIKTNFCPFCGSLMRGEKNDE